MIELPAGTHYAMTVNIPEQYGGMTSSMLQRSRAFVQQAGTEVTILTYGHQSDTDAVRQRLRDRGALVDGMHLRNFWEDLRGWQQGRLDQIPSKLPLPDTFEPLGNRGVAVDRHRRDLRDGDGTLIQSDYFRDDGTLLLSDQRPGGRSTRRVTLCGVTGDPVATWPAMFPVYKRWLNRLPRDPVAWIIVESKSTANMMLRYSRPDVALLHVVRGSHLKNGPGSPVERDFVSSRRPVMEHLDHWDGLVLLTQQQRADIEARLGPHENISVIPNSRNMPTATPRLWRRRGKAVMLASLDGRKRISHAIRAMARAEARMPRRRIHLDVWGQGALRDDLNALIAQLKAPVTLRGHAPNAAAEFDTASFSLLTSRTEALPGVLLESLSRGCIPISYDLPYGPADIITHGVDGFLVPYEDVNALADQICEVVRMPMKDLARMRRAALRRAQDFNDVTAVERWASLLQSIAERRAFAQFR